MFYSLFIPKGTKVLGKAGMVELLANVYVDGATRDNDGAYRYMVGDNEYICAGGCCEAEKTPDAMRHQDGLVWIG